MRNLYKTQKDSYSFIELGVSIVFSLVITVTFLLFFRIYLKIFGLHLLIPMVSGIGSCLLVIIKSSYKGELPPDYMRFITTFTISAFVSLACTMLYLYYPRCSIVDLSDTIESLMALPALILSGQFASFFYHHINGLPECMTNETNKLIIKYKNGTILFAERHGESSTSDAGSSRSTGEPSSSVGEPCRSTGESSVPSTFTISSYSNAGADSPVYNLEMVNLIYGRMDYHKSNVENSTRALSALMHSARVICAAYSTNNEDLQEVTNDLARHITSLQNAVQLRGQEARDMNTPGHTRYVSPDHKTSKVLMFISRFKNYYAPPTTQTLLSDAIAKRNELIDVINRRANPNG